MAWRCRCGTDLVRTDGAWTGRLAIWGLDRYRGATARRTDDAAASPQVVASIVASGRAITTVPEIVAVPFAHRGIQAIPLTDAEPAVLVLAWPEGAANPLVAELVGIARQIWDEGDQGS